MDETKVSEKKKSRIVPVLFNMMFYVSLIILILTVFVYSTRNSGAKNVLGFSFANVLTSSMQSEIPQGSFVLTQNIDSNSLEVGDDITCMVKQNVTYTHRITAIYENYENSGMRGFVTQGIENERPDEEIVYATNIVGKVIFSVPYVGDLLDYLKDNIFLVVGFLIIVLGISLSLRVLFSSKKK